MRELEYPFDGQYIRRKKKSLKRQLLEGEGFLDKNIAILGGSTTAEVKDILELFLLNCGIRPKFYESEYNMYWQDAMFDNPALAEFGPDIIYIHTTTRNITSFPGIGDSAEDVRALLESQYKHFEDMWETLRDRYHCPLIQNNFEYPDHRLLGNRDAYDIHGSVRFVTELNLRFARYAAEHDSFYINDINYQAADFGLSKWIDMSAWFMYKYAVSLDAIPYLAFNTANIIKSVYGRNKKALAIDLDNTMWGGIVGDDGVDGLVLGRETAEGEAYTEFQSYLADLKKRGILLNIISKNDEENARQGLKHPGMVLKEDDFVSVRANWDPKSVNLVNMAGELNLLPESFVFVDDNPAEREIIRQQVPGVATPELTEVESYIRQIDRAGYFEATQISADDLARSGMYMANARREQLKSSFADYEEYLKSLDMKAEIREFVPVYMDRIAQLTNKSNQFNLTTLRCSRDEIEKMAGDDEYITLYGSLSDRFGDNGVVSVAAGRISRTSGSADTGDTTAAAPSTGSRLDIILWLMSCRVLKRDMEYAMMDELIRRATARGITDVYGHYYPTAKNSMVRDFYEAMGFTLIAEDAEGNKEWYLDIRGGYDDKNHVIEVTSEREEG